MTATNFWLDRAYVVERSDHLLALVGLEVFERDAVHDQSRRPIAHRRPKWQRLFHHAFVAHVVLYFHRCQFTDF
jgi:hypothetical protein